MFITEPHTAKIALITLAAFILLAAFIKFLIINQNGKNKAKQATKERAEIERLFDETPIGFAPRSCEERCYKDFDKQMKEVFN